MSNLEKKEQNLNQLIDKLNSMSLSYSQPKHEIEKIKSEKNELANKKKEIVKNILSHLHTVLIFNQTWDKC